LDIEPKNTVSVGDRTLTSLENLPACGEVSISNNVDQNGDDSFVAPGYSESVFSDSTLDIMITDLVPTLN